MTYSAELGYDPDEWEECPEPDHFLAFSFLTRISLTVLTVLFSILFFYVLELRKLPAPRSVQAAEEIQRKSISGASSDTGDGFEARQKLARAVEMVKERQKSVSRSPKRRPSRRPFSPEEQNALIDWEREVQEATERRLRDSEKPPEAGVTSIATVDDASSTYGLPTNAFDNQSLLSEFVGAEGVVKRQQQQQIPDQQHAQGPHAGHGKLYQTDSGTVAAAGTPPCTPPGGTVPTVDDFDLRRRMAADLHAKLLAAAEADSFRNQSAEDEANRQRQKNLEKFAANAPHDRAAVENAAAIVAADVMNRGTEAENNNKKGSSSSDEGFVKVGRDEMDAVYGGDAPTTATRQLSALDAALFEYDSSAQASEKPSPTSPTARRPFASEQQRLCVAPASPLLNTDDSAQVVRRISVEGADDTTADDIEFVQSPGLADLGVQQGSPKSTTRVIAMGSGPSGGGMVGRDDYIISVNNRHQDEAVNAQNRDRINSNEANAMLRLLQEYENLPPTYNSSQQQLQQQAVQVQTPLQRPTVGTRERLLSSETLSDDRSPYDNLEGTPLTTAAYEKVAEQRPRRTSMLTRQDQTIDIDTPILAAADRPHGDVEEQRQQRALLRQFYDETEAIGGIDAAAKPALFSPPDTTHTTTTTTSGGGKDAGFVMEEEMLESDKQQAPQPQFQLDQPLLMIQQHLPDQPESAAQQITPQPPSKTATDQPPSATLGPALADKSPADGSGTATAGKFLSGGDGDNGAAGASRHAMSAEPTSRLVKTNEVFEKPEPIFDDADDAITYAPEIQSVEIPPDQLSENDNSLNLVEENFSEHQEAVSSPQVPAPPSATSKRPDAEAKVTELQQQQRPAPTTLADSTIIRSQRPAPGQQPQATGGGVQRPKAPKFMKSKHKKNGDGNGGAGSARAFFVDEESISSSTTTTTRSINKQSSLLSVLGVTSMQEMLLKLTSLDELSDAMRKAGLESTNLIFGIDYTASNKYQGEHSFRGRSLHLIEQGVENPYQQVIKIMGRTLAPFSGSNSAGIPVYGFGDLSTGDWSVFPLKDNLGDDACDDLEEVFKVYNEVTPNVDLSGPTNFAPLIYRAISICQRVQDYHILVIIADGQVTNERATRKAIVHACQYPLSIIVVGVGDGPWDMMRVFDESLPKRPWDNFHFIEFYEIMNASERSPELEFAIHSLLEIPDQYNHIRNMGMLAAQNRSKEQSPQTPLP